MLPCHTGLKSNSPQSRYALVLAVTGFDYDAIAMPAAEQPAGTGAPNHLPPVLRGRGEEVGQGFVLQQPGRPGPGYLATNRHFLLHHHRPSLLGLLPDLVQHGLVDHLLAPNPPSLQV